MEIRKLPQWPGYGAGSDGEIYSWWGRGARTYDYTRSPQPLRGGRRGKGYLGIVLVSCDGSHHSRDVHPLICEAFHGSKPGDDFEVSHQNGIKTDNRESNLQWETKSKNRSRRLGHDGGDHGWRNSRALLTKDEVTEVRRLLQETNLTHRAIGEKFGVSRVFVTKVANGHRYPRLIEDD